MRGSGVATASGKKGTLQQFSAGGGERGKQEREKEGRERHDDVEQAVAEWSLKAWPSDPRPGLAWAGREGRLGGLALVICRRLALLQVRFQVVTAPHCPHTTGIQVFSACCGPLFFPKSN